MVAVHVSDPLSVNVTGSPVIGVSVVESVSTAETGVGEEKSPVTGWIVKAVGVAATVVGEVATSCWSSTERP